MSRRASGRGGWVLGAMVDDEADRRLMGRVQAGDDQAFGELVARYQGPLFRYAASRLRSASLAEDAVQDAFLQAFSARMTFDSTRSLRPWLWTIAVNCCRRIAAQQARQPPTLSESTRSSNEAVAHATVNDAESVFWDNENHAWLRHALDQLPDEQSDAVRMRFFGELRYEEIAAVLGISEHTAKSRVRYALEKLASGWKNGGATRS